MENPGG
jgi:hypothetical protein